MSYVLAWLVPSAVVIYWRIELVIPQQPRYRPRHLNSRRAP